ncbi:UNVERIFIED_CONTAM: hypothetical protein FKN15_012341 [Acipenser sinensis]
MQESTGCTPALVMLGRELRTLVDVGFRWPPGEEPRSTAGPEYVQQLDGVHRFVRDHLEGTGMRQKRAYDFRSRGPDFEPGELVWVHCPKREEPQNG